MGAKVSWDGDGLGDYQMSAGYAYHMVSLPIYHETQEVVNFPISLLDDTLEVCDVIREQLNGNSADGGTGGIVRLEGS